RKTTGENAKVPKLSKFWRVFTKLPGEFLSPPLGGGAVHHTLQLGPTTPQDQPAGHAVALAIHVTTQPTQRHVKLLYAQRCVPLRVAPTSQYLFVLLVHHRRRFARVCV